MATNADTPKRVLVIDVGGRHVKMRMGTRAEVRRFPSGAGLSAAHMVEQVRAMTSDWSYDLWRPGAFLVCGTGPTPGLEP